MNVNAFTRLEINHYILDMMNANDLYWFLHFYKDKLRDLFNKNLIMHDDPKYKYCLGYLLTEYTNLKYNYGKPELQRLENFIRK